MSSRLVQAPASEHPPEQRRLILGAIVPAERWLLLEGMLLPDVLPADVILVAAILRQREEAGDRRKAHRLKKRLLLEGAEGRVLLVGGEGRELRGWSVRLLHRLRH